MPLPDLSQFVRVGSNAGGSPAVTIQPDSRAPDLGAFIQVGTNVGTPAEVQPSLGSEVARGYNTGLNQLQSDLFSLASLAGDTFGSEALSSFGERNAMRNADEAAAQGLSIGSLSEIKDGEDFFRYAAGALGQGLPSIGTSLASGGIGAVLARRALETAVKRAVLSRASEQLGRTIGLDTLKDPLLQSVLRKRALRGAAAGASVASFAQNTGEIEGQLKAAGINAPGTALLGGAAAGALDALPIVNLIDNLFPGVDRATAKSFVRAVAEQMGTQSALEGSTEAAQEVIGIAARAFHDPSLSLDDPKNLPRIADAAAMGAILGAVTGGAGEVAGRVGRRAAKVPADVTTAIHNTYAPVRDFVVAQRGRIQGVDEGAEVIVGSAQAQVADIFETELTSALGAPTSGAVDAAVNAQKDLGDAPSALKSTLSQISGLNERILREVRPFVTGLAETMRRQALALTKQGAALSSDALDQIRSSAKAYIAEHITPRVKAAEDATAGQLAALDIEDIADDDYVLTSDVDESENELPGDDYEGEFEPSERAGSMDPKERLADTVEPRRTFGKNSTADEAAVPYKSHADGTPSDAAIRALEETRSRYPNVSSDSVELRKSGDGHVVVVLIEGAGEAVQTDEKVSERLERARLSARENPEKQRHIYVQFPGGEGYTRLDLPTLVQLGEDLATTGGLDLTDMSLEQRKWVGLQNALAELQLRGIKIRGGMSTIARQNLILSQSGGRTFHFEAARIASRKRSDRAAEGPAGGERPDPNRDRGGATVFDRDLRTGTQEDADEARPMERVQPTVRGSDETIGTPDDVEEQFRQGVSDTEAAQNARSRRAPSTASGFDPVKARQRALRDDVTAAVAAVKRALNLPQRITVVDESDVRELQRLGDEQSSAMWGAMLEKSETVPVFVWHNAYRAVIFISERMSGSETFFPEAGNLPSDEKARYQTFAALFHELGHLVEVEHLSRASPELRARLFREWERKAGKSTNTGERTTFREWMADQFVAYAVDADRKASSTVESFFKRVGAAIRQLYNMLRRRYKVTQPYRDFVDSVAKRVRESGGTPELQQGFRNEGSVDELNVAQLGTQAQALWAQVKSFMQANATAQAAAKTALALHDRLTATLNGRLRRMPFQAAQDLADIFNVDPGAAGVSYFREINRVRGEFATAVNKVLDGLTDAQKTAVLREMRKLDGTAGNPTLPGAIALREILDRFEAYLKRKGIPLGHIPNYFPVSYDPAKVAGHEQDIVDELERRGWHRQSAEKYVAFMKGDQTFVLQPQMQDALLTPEQGFTQKRGNIDKDTRDYLAQYSPDDLSFVFEQYMNDAIKRAEFNDRLGSHSTNPKSWDKSKKFDDLIAHARRQGASDYDVRVMKDAVDAMLGRYGRDAVPPEVRKAMAATMVYQNLRILLFTVPSSLPDMAGILLRSGDAKRALRVMRENLKAAGNSQSALNEMARVWGIISDTANRHILTEQFDNHYVPAGLRKLNDKFFRLTGLNAWTNFTRAAALAVGIDFLQTAPADKLARLGLTQADIQSWNARGRPTYGVEGHNLDQTSAASTAELATDKKIADALVRFVDEAIVRPDPSQRPLWGSHPGFMLLWHLKQFMFSFYNTIGRQAVQAVKDGEAAALVLPAAFLLAMTAAGLELRQLLQYRLWGRTAPTENQDALEYMWTLTQRSGLLGAAQLAVDFAGADNHGQAAIIGLAGPTVQQASELVTRPLSQSIPKAIPGAAQFPALRQFVREIGGSPEGDS